MQLSEQVKASAKSVSIRAVKIRADGTQVDLGVISAWHRNPLVRWWWNLKIAVRALRRPA